MAEPPGGWEKQAVRWDRLFVVVVIVLTAVGLKALVGGFFDHLFH